jgi:uncharacterized membrane protein
MLQTKQVELHHNEAILDRITERCIIAAKTNRAKQRLVRTAIGLAEKEQPTHIMTILLWIAFGFLFLWAAWEIIVIGLGNG